MRSHCGHDSTLKSELACSLLTYICIFYCLLTNSLAIEIRDAQNLRVEVEHLFYHGFENYMTHAFPEDEVRPISCRPLTRNRDNPAQIEVNDALGNYSLTLIDSLSTLAILASSPAESNRSKPFRLFQDGVRDLIEQYGDGTLGPSGHGKRARGFELDSKVQVFETTIRGVGGLLSAHLFAVGDLPVRGYTPPPDQAEHARSWQKESLGQHRGGIQWDNGILYDGQLLRLAYDLGKRLLPAFWTSTGIPYPRVNLRDGAPFYANSPLNHNPIDGQCYTEQGQSEEITETCSAGAGSLVLEFTVLSRLTGDPRFEELAKRAFWSIWARRSDIDLVGAGIDAETGTWVHSYTGIGAGIDSFFEYAFKSFVLLSNDFHPAYAHDDYELDPRILFDPLSDEEHLPETFKFAWDTAHKAIARHLLRGSNYQHPHYVQGDLATGAVKAFWIDALSAFYPGLLTMAGHVEEAVQAHLLTTALWTRFSALPERWNLLTGGIEGGLGWWVGRPEFIESNYYLYRATEDPWYQYVGEMTLKDIKRRCWAQCGWTGIQDVLTGEKSDRMESFFLGETAKYLFLLFDKDHPLNHMDSPFVFSTEGHPLIIPKTAGFGHSPWRKKKVQTDSGTCPRQPADLPITISRTAARGDLFHAGSLARLHLSQQMGGVHSILTDQHADDLDPELPLLLSPINHTYFPWTLPRAMVPSDALSSKMLIQPTFDISFPTILNGGQPVTPLQRVKNGILVNSLGGLRLSMIQDTPVWIDENMFDGYRVQSINNIGLGKDEKIFLARDTGLQVLNPADPNFTRVTDDALMDLIVEVAGPSTSPDNPNLTLSENTVGTSEDFEDVVASTVRAAWQSLISQIAGLMQDSQPVAFPFNTPDLVTAQDPKTERYALPAISPTGIGAAPIPDWVEAPSQATVGASKIPLIWNRVYTTDDLCNHRLSRDVPRLNQVIVIKRGNCSFSQKLSNIPLSPASPDALQLVVIVNYKQDDDDNSDEDALFRPLLDQVQMTSSGLNRPHPIPMVMVGGGTRTYAALRDAKGVGVKRRYSVRSQGVPITNLMVV